MTLPRPFLELLPYISSHNPKDNMAYKAIIQILTLLTVNPMMKQILRTHNFIDCKSNQTGCETTSNNNVKVKKLQMTKLKKLAQPTERFGILLWTRAKIQN